jgi:hypothetical protein
MLLLTALEQSIAVSPGAVHMMAASFAVGCIRFCTQRLDTNAPAMWKRTKNMSSRMVNIIPYLRICANFAIGFPPQISETANGRHRVIPTMVMKNRKTGSEHAGAGPAGEE